MTSFELRNTSESHIDFPLTPKAFLFQGFKHIEKSPLSDYEVNNKIFAFYLNHNQPQYEVWSLRKLLATQFYAHFLVEHFTNIKYKGFKGASHIEFDFTLADLPFMNLND